MQLRMTNQREMILRELKKSKGHLSADELYERVKKFMPRISLATVYRNLEILADVGMISMAMAASGEIAVAQVRDALARHMAAVFNIQWKMEIFAIEN